MKPEGSNDRPVSTNPLLDRGSHPAWTTLRSEDVDPAISFALARAEAQLQALVQPGPRSYANTLQALDDLYDQLGRSYGYLRHLLAVCSSAELRQAHQQVQARYQAFQSDLATHQGLWRALQDFAATDEAAALGPLHRRHLEKSLRYFRRAGAGLPEAERERVGQLRVELAQLATTFEDHVLDATNAFEMLLLHEADLAGLPEGVRARARADAEGRGLKGWRFSLQVPSYLPFILHSERRDLRERMWRAYQQRATDGAFDNRPVIRQILRKRRELAKVLGYDDFADLVLEDRMVGSTRRARDFVRDLADRTRPYFLQEMDELETFAREELGLDQLQPWDLRFAFERMRATRFDLEEEALRPYLAFDRVEAGVFELAKRLFGLEVRELDDVVAWHPSVRTYAVRAEDGTELGTFHTDWFPRESKRGGAWMNGLVDGGPRPDGGFDPHVGVVVGNLTPPNADGLSLLSPDEVRTVFHEYGHLFHHLLTRVEVRARGAGAVPWDFIEVPSQILENWTWAPEGLALYAFHHQTGRSLPDDLLQRWLASRRFSEAWAQMRQLSFADMDLALHVDLDPDGEVDPVDFAAEVMGAYELRPEFARTGFLCSFSHVLSGGYAAGYYSYKWSEVLEADAFSRFEEAGLFDAETGRAFARTVMGRGDAVDADVMVHEFLGRAPDVGALVRRNLGTLPAGPSVD